MESLSDPDGASSLPLDIWAPLLAHRTGLTEIAIVSCMFPPDLTNYCDPVSTPEEDALKGRWVRVERDLSWKTGVWYLNVWYRRTRRFDVPLITSIMLLAESEESLLPEPKDQWRKAPGSLHDGVYPMQNKLFLWYKLRPPLQAPSPTQEDETEIITELDVLYGDSKPWYGFEKLEKEVTKGREGKTDSVWLTYRKGIKPAPRPLPPHFSHDGTFKIMQIADLHFSVSNGRCRDTDHTPCKYGDTETGSLLARALDAEKPDLVIFTGDQLNGQDTSWDAKSVLTKFAREVITRNISWAAVLGNHDDEATDLDRSELMQHLRLMPFSLAEPGPKNIAGAGNYVIKVRSPDPSKTHLLTLYFLDSGAYEPHPFVFWKPPSYDWIKPSQRDWFLSESSKINPIERPFTPDGANDLGHIWKSRSTDERQAIGGHVNGEVNRRLAKPNALMFFHIPLPEAYYEPDFGEMNAKLLDVGKQLEGPGAAKHNGGFFEEGVLRAPESEQGGTEVKVIGNGHCHLTDNCRRVHGIWNCFGGGGSYSGYGKIGFDRRFRIYSISDFGETIKTYKRTEHDDIVDEMVLVGQGAPAAYTGGGH